MMLLSTRGLTRHFGGLTAVDAVDFDLPAGQIRALIGPNGAGKTTFVSLVTGRVAASAGQVLLEGEDITALPAFKRIQRGIGYTFQITSIFPELDGFENVRLAAQRGFAGSANALEARARETLEQVGLSDEASQRASDLAYGHQRLLEIAMGLAQRPKLLILDEPTQGLAAADIKEFNRLIKGIANQTTVLLIEHNMDVVMELAEQITVLEQGRVLAEGTPAQIRANAQVREAYLGT